MGCEHLLWKKLNTYRIKKKTTTAADKILMCYGHMENGFKPCHAKSEYSWAYMLDHPQ